MDCQPSSAEQVSSLPACSLCEELERLVHIERRAAWLVCHHFAVLADRFDEEDPALSSYESVYQLGHLRLGMSERQVRERIRVGRALRQLPQTRIAFASGAISYAKVREITRIAEPDSEEHWLHTARAESVRSLERHVARARRVDPVSAPAPREVKTSPDAAFVDVQLRLPVATWELVLRAMEATRQTTQVSLSDAEALAAVARWALASRTPHGEKDEVRFMDDVAARIDSDESPPDEAASIDVTRPGPCPTQSESPATDPSDTTRPEQKDALAPAPGRCAISAECVEAARALVPAIESGEAESPDQLIRLTGLSAQQFAVTILELELAGIVAQTHRGLMLTPWALRHRFKAVAAKRWH